MSDLPLPWYLQALLILGRICKVLFIILSFPIWVGLLPLIIMIWWGDEVQPYLKHKYGKNWPELRGGGGTGTDYMAGGFGA